MTIYYAVVEGDPLDSGEGSQVIATARVATIGGEDGRHRQMVFIGDSAWCAACKSTGVVTGSSPVRAGGRMVDFVNGGRYQAVGGDEVICKCQQHPRIIPVNGRSWRIKDYETSAGVPSRAASQSANAVHDQQFMLTDKAGLALANTYYTVRMPSGGLVHGVSDSIGRTERYVTNGTQSLKIYLGHKQEA